MAPTAPVDLVVLDTNVCLDLLVFADPRAAALGAALASGQVRAVTDAECRAEWRRVLAYPHWELDEAAQAAFVVRFDALVRVLDDGSHPPGTVALPRCRDPDDQKFLQLAQRAGARWLLTRDDELLRLSRRTLRDCGFGILTPEAWAREALA